MNDITYAVSVDVNNPVIPYNVYVASVLDSNVRYLEITLYENGNIITLSNTATATASLVTDNVLVDDSVECTISNNIITVPLEDLQRHGNLDVQVTVTEGTKVLAIPFPIQVRVTPNIAENAQIDENSLGSYAEVVHEIAEARGTYTTLHDAINAKAPLSTAYTFNTTTTNVVYNANNPKIIYLNAVVDGESGIVITSAHNASNASFQIFFGRNGTTKIRYFTGGTSYSDWFQVTELVGNKKNSITASNRTSTDFYPSIKAVVDYLAANYLGSGDNTVSWANLAAAVQTLINGKESTSNKLTSEAGIDEDSTDTEYPTAKAVFDFGGEIIDLVNEDISAVQTLINGKESASNKLTSEAGIDSNSTDTEYPSAKAVYDLGVEILALVNDDISNVESRLVLKESFSNKTNAIAGNETSGQYYPTTKAVYDYGSQISSAVEDVKAYIGYTSGDILGLHADFEHNVFTRLGAAVGLNAGSDFDAFPMYGQRRRVVVNPNGVIIDGYSPEDVGESDTDVDVMVYQPKFYYKVVPLKLEKQSSGLGYHIRKANYYISSTPHAGFKLHPLFFDKNGNEIEYVLFSAYEASYMWRRQVSTNGTDFRYVDSIFHDGVGTDTTIDTSAVLKSLPGVKPISGQYKAMTKANMESLAQRKSASWHIDTIQSVSANQLLFMIEAGTFNIQAALGQGVVNHYNKGSSLTGATSAAEFNTASGMANQTISDVDGTESVETTNGKLSVSYRGIENPCGNINKILNGVRIIGDGQMNGGQPYISNDFSMNSQNYKPVGFTMPNSSGYISAFGYSDSEHDWLFIPSENNGNNVLPVGDYCYVGADLNGERIVRFGGPWYSADTSGLFYISVLSDTSTSNSLSGCRLLFVPTATV